MKIFDFLVKIAIFRTFLLFSGDLRQALQSVYFHVKQGDSIVKTTLPSDFFYIQFYYIWCMALFLFHGLLYHVKPAYLFV